MNDEMHRLNINGEEIYVECPKRFEWILEEKLGRDAADYFRNLLEEANVKDQCGGECDKTYEIHEHYQRVIGDVVEELEAAKVHKTGYAWTSGKVDVEAFERALKALNNER